MRGLRAESGRLTSTLNHAATPVSVFDSRWFSQHGCSVLREGLRLRRDLHVRWPVRVLLGQAKGGMSARNEKQGHYIALHGVTGLSKVCRAATQTSARSGSPAAPFFSCALEPTCMSSEASGSQQSPLIGKVKSSRSYSTVSGEPKAARRPDLERQYLEAEPQSCCMGCATSCCADSSDVGSTPSQERQRWRRRYRHLLAIALVANAFSHKRSSDVAFRTVARLYAHEVSLIRDLVRGGCAIRAWGRPHAATAGVGHSGRSDQGLPQRDPTYGGALGAPKTSVYGSLDTPVVMRRRKMLCESYTSGTSARLLRCAFTPRSW